MSYLNLDLDYFTHPKTMRLVGRLGPGSEVYPIRLWCYCGKYHSYDGRLAGYSAEEVESCIAWSGEKGMLVNAMCEVGFLRKIAGEKNGFFVNDFLEHNGHLSMFKKRAKQAARKRWGIKSSNATSNAKRKLKQSPKPNLTNLTNKITSQNEILPHVFNDIWSKYPNKVGKKAAEKHFNASVTSQKDWDDITKALEHYLSSKRVKKGFIQNGATWFNNWRDWIDYKEDSCKKCNDKGSFVSSTGYRIICDCPAGKNK